MKNKYLYYTALALAIIGFIVLINLLPSNKIIQFIIDWVDSLGVMAPIVFVGAYLFVTVLMLPASPLTMAAGMLFGLFSGTIYVLIGATMGMAATFLIARYAARKAVEKKLRQYPRFAAIDKAVDEGGWKIVALLRLSPAVPFNLQNYLYGLTAIKFWPCTIASAFTILPGTFMYVYLGYAGRAGLTAAAAEETERGMGQWALLVLGLIATIVATVYITRLARKALKKHAVVEQAESEQQPSDVEAPLEYKENTL